MSQLQPNLEELFSMASLPKAVQTDSLRLF